MEDTKKDEVTSSGSAGLNSSSLGRRDLMKLGVGAGVAVAGMLTAPGALAQQGQSATSVPPASPLAQQSSIGDGTQHWPDIRESEMVTASMQVGYNVSSGPGWVNNSGRASGNGPMDETTRRIVEWVHSYSPSDLTDSLVAVVNDAMVDSIGVMYGAFESDPARINARLAARYPGPSTVFGYGIKTSEEMAAFANGCLIRHTDFNVGSHNTEILGGIFAVGEAQHSSGAQVMAALVIAYEVIGALANAWAANQDHLAGWDAPYHCIATAMACGSLMGLNQDKLANAVSLAIVPHMPLYSHIGTASMWKGSHSSESVKNGTWAAVLAKEGFTGWCTPFEGRDGLLSHLGPFARDLKFPTSPDGRTVIQNMLGDYRGYKFTASEGNTIDFHETIAPSVMEWTKPEEIASMEFYAGSMYRWQEVCDPPKWDPRNRETADHSMPYNIARHLIDGYIYLDSFAKEKYMDPKARELMNKITCHPGVPSKPQSYLTVRKKSGEEKVFNSGPRPTRARADLVAKYDRLAEFGGINKDQAARARDQWMNLRAVKDIGEAIQIVAKFGNPKALTDDSPSRIA